MTAMPSFPDAPPLRTDAEVLERVEQLLGRASSPSTLWVLLVDGDDRQTPVVMPIDDAPPWPDGFVDGLAPVVAGVVPDLATRNGPGSVIFVRERLGSRHVTDQDRAWAQGLTSMCGRVGVVLRGVYGSTPFAVRRLG
jgi:hypothetical protein